MQNALWKIKCYSGVRILTKLTLNCLRIINVLHVLTDSKKGRCVVMVLVYAHEYIGGFYVCVCGRIGE